MATSSVSAKLAILCAAAQVACGGGSRTGEHVDVDTGVACGQTPAKLADYVRDLPEPAAVQVPTIRPGDDDVFYLLNWDTGDGDGGYLMRVPKRGGPPERMAVIEGGGSGSGHGLAVTRTAVIFSQAGGGPPDEGSIVSVPTAGGDSTTLSSTKGIANALAADDQNVYFVDGEGTKSVPLTGGSVRMLTSLKPYSITVDGSTLYLAEFAAEGTVSSIPVDGGPLSTLAVEPIGALQTVRCGENLCWLTPSVQDASLRQLDREGNVTTLVGGLYKPGHLVFDGTSFFLTAGWGLTRISADGTRSVGLQSDGGLSGIAFDDSCLYWSSFSGIYAWDRNAANTAPDFSF